MSPRFIASIMRRTSATFACSPIVSSPPSARAAGRPRFGRQVARLPRPGKHPAGAMAAADAYRSNQLPPRSSACDSSSSARPPARSARARSSARRALPAASVAPAQASSARSARSASEIGLGAGGDQVHVAGRPGVAAGRPLPGGRGRRLHGQLHQGVRAGRLADRVDVERDEAHAPAEDVLQGGVHGVEERPDRARALGRRLPLVVAGGQDDGRPGGARRAGASSSSGGGGGPRRPSPRAPLGRTVPRPPRPGAGRAASPRPGSLTASLPRPEPAP